MPLQIRRGTNAQRVAMTQALAAGELLYVTDDQRLYIGNGNTLGGVQITGYTNENAVDAVGAALVAGTHTGITFTYGTTQDDNNRIDAVISYPSLLSNLNLNSHDINGTGNIDIAGDVTVTGTFTGPINGDVVADSATVLVDSVAGSVNLNGTVMDDIIPDATLSYDIGSDSNRFKDLWLSGSSIHLGNALISATDSAVNLPPGSTIGGVGIGTVTGVTDIQGSVFGDNSVTLVNAVNNELSTGVITIAGDTVSSVSNKVSIGDIHSPVEADLFSGATTSFMNLTGLTNGSSSPWINTKVSRGTLISPAALNVGDIMSGTLFFGYDGTGYSRSVTLATQVTPGTTVSTGIVPGDLNIYVQSSRPGATAGNNETFTFNSKGVASASVMQATGFANSAARDAAITAPTGGMMTYLQDSGVFCGWNAQTSTWVVLG